MQDQCQKSPPFTKHQSKQFKPPIHSSISQKNTTATHIYSPQDETEEKTLKLESTTGKGENPPLLSLSKAYNKRLLHPSNLEESKKQAPFIKPNQAHNISSVTSSFSQTTAAQPTDHPLTTLAIPQEHLKEERQPSLIPFKEVVARLEKLLSLSIDTELSQNEVAIFIFESLQNYIENSILTEQFIHEAYACLFHSELALHAQEFLNENRSFIKPHPAYVIFSLADCFKALSQEDNFLTIITKAKNYFKSKVEDLLIAHQNQPSVSDYLKKETNAVFIKSVNECPLYTATQWFGTENLNPVFILRTQNFQPEWVFKPTTLDEKSNLSDIRDCEHYAFKMNFHEQFPIPAVFLIQFRGVSGTIQPFIPDTVQFKDIPKDKRILILPALRKLLIFDLLFINHDRNPSNILYRKEGDSYTCYGIDHEHSFQYVGGAATMTQIGLIQKLSQSLHFEDFIDTIQDICSKECCEQYQKRLGECFNHENRLDQHKQDFTNTELENKMLDWIQDVGSKLREAQQNFSEVVNNIKQEMQIIKIAKETSDFQSDQSYLND